MRVTFTTHSYSFDLNDGAQNDVPPIDGVALLEAIGEDGATLILQASNGEGGVAVPVVHIVLRYNSAGGAFAPGILVVPETNTLFVAAGERVLVYDLHTPARLATDSADCGFWAWHRFGDLVVMQAELEVVAWTLDGRKCWSTFADPPHTLRWEGGHLVLDDFSGTRHLDLKTGREV